MVRYRDQMVPVPSSKRHCMLSGGTQYCTLYSYQSEEIKIINCMSGYQTTNVYMKKENNFVS